MVELIVVILIMEKWREKDAWFKKMEISTLVSLKRERKTDWAIINPIFMNILDLLRTTKDKEKALCFSKVRENLKAGFKRT